MERDVSENIKQTLNQRAAARAGGRKRRIAAVAGVCAAALAGAAGLGWQSRMSASAANAETSAPKDTRPTVAVIPAQRGKSATELTLPATVLPIQETVIYARTSGYVKRWLVDIGARVKTGQLLAEIETPEVDRELAQAVAAVAQARANLQLAQSTADRWEKLLKDKMVSQQQVDEKLSAVEARKADLAANEANAQRLRQLISFQRITAPFEGIITARNVEVGALIAAGGDKTANWLYKVAKINTLKLYVNVPQSHARAIQAGMVADVILREYPGRPFVGKVARTAGALDPQSKTLLTEVQVPNEQGELLAGMYAQVRFKIAQAEPAIVLPANTLIVRADGPQVAAVENNTIRIRKVVLGRDFGQQIEIISGVQEKEMIVTNPSDSVRDGTQVTIAVPATPERK